MFDNIVLNKYQMIHKKNIETVDILVVIRKFEYAIVNNAVVCETVWEETIDLNFSQCEYLIIVFYNVKDLKKILNLVITFDVVIESVIDGIYFR